VKRIETNKPLVNSPPTDYLAIIARSPLLDISDWGRVCDVTITLKQGGKSDDGTWVKLDEYECRRAFRHFMNLLNRTVYNSAVQRFGKRIRVIPVLEKEATGRWHWHCAMELPAHIDSVDFERLIQTCWEKVHWGYRRTLVRDNADQGWVKYMLKPWQKTEFDDCTNCIDLENLHNPSADA
jgi:hypothetical protein